MEASLALHYPNDNLKYLWAGGLTLRRLHVLLTHLPPESPYVRLGQPTDMGTSNLEVLLMDVYGALVGELHPAHPGQWAKRNEKKTAHDELKARQAFHNSR